MSQPNKTQQKNPNNDNERPEADLDAVAGGAINPSSMPIRTGPVITRPTNPIPDGPNNPTPKPTEDGIQPQPRPR